MANDNNIKRFTATDIEKYHKGLLSSKDMHALEKAALDDAFLAEALEGYASRVNLDADINELRSRLAKRVEEENKIIPIDAGKHSSFSWWKIAAMIVLVLGAGLLVYQFSFNKKSVDIAEANSVKKNDDAIKDTGNASPPALLNADTNTTTVRKEEQEKDEIKSTDVQTSKATLAKEQKQEINTEANTVLTDKPLDNTAPLSVPPVNPAPEKSKGELLNDDSRQKKIIEQKQEDLKARKQENPIAGIAREAEQKRNVAAQNQPVENNLHKKAQERKVFNQANIFRGRVTDTHDNALPFSNITNLDDSIGTYSDARGYFILTSPDSVLNVQVRSLGFESNNVQLQNNVPNNPVQLQEDRSSLAEVVISNKKPNSNRARDGNMVLQEPEPADGWSNYDIYLANNLKVPNAFKNKPAGNTGEVELSFDIDKNGEPVNITVKKSLCDSCDKEAIRLVKEGPKWKRKAKKGKATVKIAF